MYESIALLSREESLATCQRKYSFESFLSQLVPRRNSKKNNQGNLDRLRIISKDSKALYRELSRLDSNL